VNLREKEDEEGGDNSWKEYLLLMDGTERKDVKSKQW